MVILSQFIGRKPAFAEQVFEERPLPGLQREPGGAEQDFHVLKGGRRSHAEALFMTPTIRSPSHRTTGTASELPMAVRRAVTEAPGMSV